MPMYAYTLGSLICFLRSSLDSGMSSPYLCCGNQHLWQFNATNSLKLTFVRGQDNPYQ